MLNHVDANDCEDAMDECLELLRALSDRTRQEILKMFAFRKEINVNEIASHFSLSRPTVSHHLNLMRRARLLNSRKEGKEVYYSFNKPYVTRLMGAILEQMKTCC